MSDIKGCKILNILIISLSLFLVVSVYAEDRFEYKEDMFMGERARYYYTQDGIHMVILTDKKEGYRPATQEEIDIFLDRLYSDIPQLDEKLTHPNP